MQTNYKTESCTTGLVPKLFPLRRVDLGGELGSCFDLLVSFALWHRRFDFLRLRIVFTDAGPILRAGSSKRGGSGKEEERCGGNFA